MALTEDLAACVAEAGYTGKEPIVVGLHRRGEEPAFYAQGLTGTGQALGSSTVVYGASLAKQITAGCAALLAQDGALDLQSTLADWLPELPDWAQVVRLRHLLFHTSALPSLDPDAVLAGVADWTSRRALEALSQASSLLGAPGVTYSYSGAGYICLAQVIERAAGQALPALAESRIFVPLGMNDTCFWPGPDPQPEGAAPLADPHPAPLSLGDGGLWSTAADLLLWAQGLNSNQLAVTKLMESPGTLDDGTPLDYAWGMGVRSYHGHRVFRHGGGWPSLRALLARVPDLNVSFVTLALADDTERRVDLAEGLLALVTTPDPD